MAISFPANPNENDSFTSNGKTWVWSGGRWKIVGTSNRGLSLEVSDTPPSNPVQGDMWYESDTGRTFTYYDNVWVEVGNTAAVYSFIADTDADTKIQVEESSDEDVIRFDVAGTEKGYFNSSGLTVSGDISVTGSYVGLSSDSIGDADDDTKIQVEATADSDAIKFTTAATPRFEVTSDGHIIPSADVTYDLGSAQYRFRDLYLSGNTIDLGGATISYDGSSLRMGAIEMDATGSGGLAIPSGTTAERPASPSTGMIRFNETTGEPEWYSSAAGIWVNFRNGPNISLTYLVLAGGGGGGGGDGGGGGGGGGAGGYRVAYQSETSGGGAPSEEALSLAYGTSYTVTVGAGGTGRSTSGTETNGSNSVFHSVTSVGGGTGGQQASYPGDSGGSGGGGGGGDGTGIQANTGAAGTANQGYAGGNGGHQSGSWLGGGGGGGAGSAGANISSSGTPGGNGGNGVSSAITGTPTTRGGGGGGSANTNTGTKVGGSGGSGGGGKGGDNSGAAGGAGTANTGGGGGGGAHPASSPTSNGGNGGSGLVVLRYPSNATITATAGLTSTTTTVGSEKVTVFTAGTGTVSWA